MLDALDEISSEHDTSRSEVVRQMLWDLLEAENEWTPPEHERILANRERVKHENKVAQLRGGFRSRIRRDLKRRFKNGWTPEEVRETLPGYVSEAEILWPDDDEAEERAERICEDLMERYEEAHETSAWDHDDVFSGFSGVQEGRREEEMEEKRAPEQFRPVVIEICRETPYRELRLEQITTRTPLSEDEASRMISQITGTSGEVTADD